MTCRASYQNQLSNHQNFYGDLKTFSVFFIRKLLRGAQKARIKIVVLAIYTYLFFSYKYTLLFYWKIKSCCDRYFPQKIRPKNNVQWYIWRGYSSMRIGFSMINKRHTLPIVYSMLVKIVKFWSLLLHEAKSHSHKK